MLFPSLDSLATKEVITASREATIQEAIALMNQHNIRDVIVTGAGDYHILTAPDLIRFRLEGVDYTTPLSQLVLSRVPSVSPQANVLEAIEAISEGIDYICLVDAQGALKGIVSYTDLAGSIDPDILVETQRIGDLFRREKTLMVDRQEPTRSVFDQMKAQAQSAAIVFDQKKAVGILTQKDVIKLLGRSADLRSPVGEFMSTPLISIPDSLTIKEGLSYCREHKIKRIVVHSFDGGIMGIISQKDLVATAYNRWARLIKDHQRELKELNRILEERTETLEKLASTDALTGLFNRHMFSELFKRELAQSRRYKTPLSLVLLDVDHFKKVNDTHGHLVGDGVLKQIAALMRESVRIADITARWGGEEFAVMLPHTTVEGAHITAEKIRSAIEAAHFESVGAVTASFGIAQLEENESQEPFFDRADKALYRAKVAGRNRVEVG